MKKITGLAVLLSIMMTAAQYGFAVVMGYVLAEYFAANYATESVHTPGVIGGIIGLIIASSITRFITPFVAELVAIMTKRTLDGIVYGHRKR